MNCFDCGTEMASSIENWQYTESGLPHVILEGLELRRCPNCGEEELCIPRLEELHQTIAMAVVSKSSRLTPAEIKFLRKHLGWSGVDFAKHMGVTPESVSRWENAHEPMGPVADRLLRLMVVTMAPTRDYSLDMLVELNDEALPARLRLCADSNGWHSDQAA